jgi:cephalosporin-C deacetylase-like acetyl esterase
VAVAVLALSGCVRVTHPNGSNFCGVHINTGAMSVVFEPLDPAVPAPSADVPTASALPPLLSPTAPALMGARYIRTTADCGTGAIVTVTPADAARLVLQVTAPHGGVAGIVLDQVTAPATVYAWVGGNYEGGMRLTPDS